MISKSHNILRGTRDPKPLSTVLTVITVKKKKNQEIFLVLREIKRLAQSHIVSKSQVKSQSVLSPSVMSSSLQPHGL